MPMELLSVNLTSTKVPEWKEDCQRFCQSDMPFELRDVTAPEHEEFVENMRASCKLKVTRVWGRAIRFERR